MVTVWSVIFNSIWIVGLSGALATISYIDWLRKTHQHSWKVATAQPSFAVPLNLSMFLVSLGIGLSGWQGVAGQPMWQTILWAILALLFLFQSIAAVKVAKSDSWYTE